MASFLKFAVVLAACVALSHASCVEVAERAGKGMAGGWGSQEDSLVNDADFVSRVEALAHNAAKVYNQVSNDIRYFEALALGEEEAIVQKAYTQVVNGLNYCIRFTMQSTSCKTRSLNNVCSDKSLVCDAKVYTDFKWSPAGNGPAPLVTLPMHCVAFPTQTPAEEPVVMPEANATE